MIRCRVSCVKPPSLLMMVNFHGPLTYATASPEHRPARKTTRINENICIVFSYQNQSLLTAHFQCVFIVPVASPSPPDDIDIWIKAESISCTVRACTGFRVQRTNSKVMTKYSDSPELQDLFASFSNQQLTFLFFSHPINQLNVFFSWFHRWFLSQRSAVFFSFLPTIGCSLVPYEVLSHYLVLFSLH